MSLSNHQDYKVYPETKLRNRFKLAHDWIPAGSRRVLDGGCAFGYGTRHFQKGDAKVWGVDPNAEFIEIASKRYPNIGFEVCGLEKTPFPDGFFDVIILNDVLEHVRDERKTLNEMCRILSHNGTFITTTPHRGLFAFLDPENYTYYLRIKLPWLYRLLYRAKYGKLPPDQIKPGYEQLHRHYSLNDLKQLLDASNFKGKYSLEKVFRSGLFIDLIARNFFELLCIFLGIEVATKITRPLQSLIDWDYFINYGPMAYTIALRIKKL